ncbi:MAG: GNAT family N-acetyltransferase [Actinomycetes bacterium]
MLLLGEIPTSRLLLRPFAARDADDVWALHGDPELRRYIPWPERTREESLAWLEQRRTEDRLAQEGDAVAWAVERRADGRVIGSVNAWWRSQVHRHAEIGFVVERAAHGAGYAREATAAVVDRLFEALDLHRVSSRADARNVASAALMARLGMRQEAHFREDEWFKGEWTDTVVFAVLRAEWRVA